MSDIEKAFDLLRAAQANQPTPEQILGDPPWDRERLEKAYFAHSKKVWDVLETHPGYQLYDYIECLTQSFALFDLAVRDLVAAIYRFQHLFRERGLQRHHRQTVIDEVKLDLEKNLFTASQAALALVDHSRRISDKVKISGYDAKKAVFADDPSHQFLQGLRVCVYHVFYITPNWEFQSNEHGDKARFLISKKQLMRYKEWKPLARKFLDEMGDALDLEAFLRDYREKVREFQSWFVAQLRQSDSKTLSDYLESRRVLKAVGARCWWNIILSQVVIQNRRDPFAYLDKFLDAAELERVYAFPLRSQEQVDYIITALDEFGACDAALRETAYRAFGVKIDKSPIKG